ncbi:unnamed protein product [Bemisia tabaci]|uniref:Uncharacterized protein n=1 Tax=Bemisia tabaci TaxID=7038 RepID=A0A9P0F943_BEMTA|nr:unnamed protein product [Bemisia tabaci]
MAYAEDATKHCNSRNPVISSSILYHPVVNIVFPRQCSKCILHNFCEQINCKLPEVNEILMNMERFSELCLSYFFLPSCILSAAVIINATRSHIPESLTDVEEEASREKTEDTNTLESLSAALGNSIEVSSDIPCHMDVQVDLARTPSARPSRVLRGHWLQMSLGAINWENIKVSGLYINYMTWHFVEKELNSPTSGVNIFDRGGPILDFLIAIKVEIFRTF